MKITQGTTKQIFVYSLYIKKNKGRKDENKIPTIGVYIKEEKRTVDCFGVIIKGPSEVVYSQTKKVAHANIWIETTSELELIDKYQGDIVWKTIPHS